MSQRPASKEQINKLAENLNECAQVLGNLPPEVQEAIAKELKKKGITGEKINSYLNMLTNMPTPPLAPYNRNISIPV